MRRDIPLHHATRRYRKGGYKTDASNDRMRWVLFAEQVNRFDVTTTQTGPRRMLERNTRLIPNLTPCAECGKPFLRDNRRSEIINCSIRCGHLLRSRRLAEKEEDDPMAGVLATLNRGRK